MNTEIEYLKQLETDLKDAAAREVAKPNKAGTPARHRGSQMWMKVAGVAAAFLIVAGAIGFLADGTSDKFQQVGDAVASDGDSGGTAPEQVGDATPGDGVTADVPESAPTTRERLFGQPVFDENLNGRTSTPLEGQQQDLSKIVRDGRIGIVIPDGKFGDAVDDLTFIAEQHGGFILSSSTNNDRSGTFVLRIPAKRFDRALGQIRDLATRVKFQEIRGDDVTAEFIDQQARLRILLARKALLFDLFQQANTTEEILQMAKQLDDVQLRIEQIQGQLRFINDQVAESTLRVSIQEQNAPKRAATTDVDNPDLGSSIDLGVQGFLRIVGAVIVGLGYLIPLTLLGALVWIVVWFVRRRRAIS